MRKSAYGTPLVIRGDDAARDRRAGRLSVAGHVQGGVISERQ